MFVSAHAVPASTATRTAATTADTIGFRDHHFFIVILLKLIDAPPSLQDSMRRSMGVHNGLSRAALQLTRGHTGNNWRSRGKRLRENDLQPLDRPRWRAYKEGHVCRDQSCGFGSAHLNSTHRPGR